jgi:hypothetical protein
MQLERRDDAARCARGLGEKHRRVAVRRADLENRARLRLLYQDAQQGPRRRADRQQQIVDVLARIPRLELHADRDLSIRAFLVFLLDRFDFRIHAVHPALERAAIPTTSKTSTMAFQPAWALQLR